jgi:beta-mannosidase
MVSHGSVIMLDDGWEYAPGNDSDTIPTRACWRPVGRKTTVGAVVDAVNVGYPSGIDDREHWFGCDVFLVADGETGCATFLRLAGVATIAEFSWNGVVVGHSDSMFREHMIDVTRHVRPGRNRLDIRVLSLTDCLAKRKPVRTRWKTRLVEDQKLRTVRTTLLGRTTGWSPPTTVLGLWRSVSLLRVNEPVVVVNDMRTYLTGDDGTVSGAVELLVPRHLDVTAASIELGFERIRVSTASCTVERLPSTSGDFHAVNAGGAVRIKVSGQASFADPQRWWPHTHGAQPLYEVSIRVEDSSGRLTVLPLGSTGFRTIGVDSGADMRGFGLVVNGRRVFARGGAWFPLDPTTFSADVNALRERLTLVRDGGHNLIRISGTTAYESEEFYSLCDELGLLVWQDLPLANFDYPVDDAFTDGLSSEVITFLRRVALTPALVIVCGNSEVQQQAAMMGIATEAAESGPLTETCRRLVEGDRRGLVFVPSSPTGGHLPFSSDAGIAHYFGVGAYRRPLTDARHAGVRFAAECLALSNVPVPSMVRSVIGDGIASPGNPRWKERIPRDRGAGWDFEDVRDFYARELFDLDLADVRYTDPERYLSVARAVSCAVIEHTLAEWRRTESSCQGALLWTLNDLWPGAGWGLIDSGGQPKAAYWGAKRALSARTVLAVDEGLNGLDLHLHNDGPVTVEGRLHVTAVRGTLTVHSGSVDVAVSAHGSERLRVDSIFGQFTDPTYAYRFGPRAVDAISAVWADAEDRVLGRCSYVPSGERLAVDPALVLEGEARWLSAARFVTVDFGAWRPVASDDHFTLLPDGRPHVVRYRVSGDSVPKRGFVSALNGGPETVFAVPPREES